MKNKRRGRKIIYRHIAEGIRESHPSVHDLQHPRLGKPRRGLQIMDTRMGFPCPFHNVVIDSINRCMTRQAWHKKIPSYLKCECTAEGQMFKSSRLCHRTVYIVKIMLKMTINRKDTRHDF